MSTTVELLEAVSDPEDACGYSDSLARIAEETCQKCGVENHLRDWWTGFDCPMCMMAVCENCECTCVRCSERNDWTDRRAQVCWYCCQDVIPPMEEGLVFEPLPEDRPDEESPYWEWTFRQSPYYTVSLDRDRTTLLRTRICLRCGAYDAIAGLTPGNCAERFGEPCVFIEEVHQRNRSRKRCSRCGCAERFVGVPSWCCEKVRGVKCDLDFDDEYDAGPNAGRRTWMDWNAGRRTWLMVVPDVTMPGRGIGSTLPAWVSRREARIGDDASNFDDGLADHADDELGSSDEENPWLALAMAPLSLESDEPPN